MLRELRIAVAVVMLSLVTFYFIDFAGLLPEGFSVLEHIQFVPAVLSLSTAVLVALVALTLLLGRLYCSVICPMGIFQDVIARISRGLGKKPKKKKRYQYSPARNILRYTLLAATVVALVSGFILLASLLDPYAAYGRIAANVFAPVYLAGNNLLEALFTAMGNYTFYRMDIYVHSAFALSIALLTLLGVGYLAWKHGRTYCNTICPVGTFLGLISRFSWWKIRIDPAKCTHCGVCATRCKASCIDSRNQRIDYSRCVDCFDCLDACRQDALSFSAPKKASVLPSEAAPAKAAPKDPSRRLDRILGHPLALVITTAQSKLRPDIILIGRQEKPPNRLRAILIYTFSVIITQPQIVLRMRHTLLGGQTISTNGLDRILFHSITVFIAKTKDILRIGKPLFGRLEKRFECPLVISIPHFTQKIIRPQIELGKHRSIEFAGEHRRGKFSVIAFPFRLDKGLRNDYPLLLCGIHHLRTFGKTSFNSPTISMGIHSCCAD